MASAISKRHSSTPIRRSTTTRGEAWSGQVSRTAPPSGRSQVSCGTMATPGVLVLVRPLLHREGRLSYRSLMRICGLDEAGLADLREDLIFQRLARDEDGKGLVWIGSAPPPGLAAVASDTATPAASAIPPLA